MNKFSVFLYWLLPLLSFAQTRHPAFDAFSKSDPSGLSNLLNSKVEYCYNGKIAYLDKYEATKALGLFMTNNPPKSVNALHRGASKSNESQYQIAQYLSTNGKSFRIMIYAEENASTNGIREIKIDPQ
ncbi:MAG: DUF4783 domain-containing protein [Saprospiraceae bacterium]|nr:DUF4783 domain-containing protein [Saprospiraceae bacterium]